MKGQPTAAGAAIRRMVSTALSFGLMWGILSLFGDLTVATKMVMSALAGLSVLLLGPRIWEWIVVTLTPS